MDPFSLTVGAVSLVDVCWRLVKFLREIPTAISTAQFEIDSLISEVESLRVIVSSIEESLEDSHASRLTSPLKRDNFDGLCKNCQRSLDICRDVVPQLEHLVKQIYGKSGSMVAGKLDALTKQSRRRAKAASVQQLRNKLSIEKQNLQILLMGIDLYNHQSSRDKLDQLSTDLRTLNQDLKLQTVAIEENLPRPYDIHSDQDEQGSVSLSTIEQFREAVQSVAIAISVATPNRFFDIPQPVSSIYTGRELFLERLQTTLLSFHAERTTQEQRRFVIYGIGGSGKTQFCSKFAEINRENFWGVFWVDASSRERLKQTYAEIAKFGKVEAEPRAAMHWLSNCKERWLLIIDNADDSRIDLEEYFPRGERGHIIITTRNPAHRIYGNVGTGAFEFQGMEDDDANTLLLRAARVAEPWDSESSSWAVKITKELGFLPLALVHAGAAIRNDLCSLKDYLKFYDEDWERIRRMSKSFFGSGNQCEQYTSALATYELPYRGIEQKGTESSEDAVQLLKLFSFLYFKNVRFDILQKAVVNAGIERIQQAKEDEERSDQPLTWYQRYENIRLSIFNLITKDRSPPALPRFIRGGRESGNFDGIRVRYALQELVQMSLVTHDESNDSYSIHPLVHRWARERPAMTTSEQAVWCHVEATTLAHSILFPPLGDTEDEELFRRDLLPHIDHVRYCQEAIDRRIAENRKLRRHRLVQWPRAEPSFGRAQALPYAKFSVVFAQNGRWNVAEELQLRVKLYTDNTLGLGQPPTRRITLALALTYWSQGRSDEAADLQNSVLQACLSYLGPENVETLMTMDLLGQTLWQQGRYSQAKILQKRAVEGLARLKGLHHEVTLSAMGGLGRTLAKFYENLAEATRCLRMAHEGLCKILGGICSRGRGAKGPPRELNTRPSSYW